MFPSLPMQGVLGITIKISETCLFYIKRIDLIAYFREISSTDSALIPETENPHPGGASVTHEVITLTHSIDIDSMKYKHI